MTIDRVEVKDFLLFKGEFAADFCSGINVLIGGNATGKTTLLKVLYRLCESSKSFYTEEFFFAAGRTNGEFISRPFEYLRMQSITDNAEARICVKSYIQFFRGDDEGSRENMIFSNGEWVRYDPQEYKDEYTNSYAVINGDMQDELVFKSKNYRPVASVYIPVTNMLSNSSGLLEMIDSYELDFDATLIDILRNAQRPATRELMPNCSKIINKIGRIIGGEVLFDNGRFFIKKSSEQKVEFSIEASGFVRLSLLWKLLRNGLLESGTVLFWDEPENSLNPELIPILVDILLELSRNGVQIFLATHSEILASYFAVNRQNKDNVMFTSLYKDGEQIKVSTSSRFDLLEPNNLTAEPVRLYEKEIEKGLSGNG